MTSFFYVVSTYIQCAAISSTVKRRYSSTMASTAAMSYGVTTGCAWPGRGESVNRTIAVHELPSPLVHLLYWTFIRRWISMDFTPSLPKKKGWQKAVLLWCMFQAGPTSLHYYFAVVLRSCIVLPPVGHSSNHQYHYCQLTRQSNCVPNFYRTFKVLIWFSLLCLSLLKATSPPPLKELLQVRGMYVQSKCDSTTNTEGSNMRAMVVDDWKIHV